MPKKHTTIKKQKQSLLYTPVGIGFLAAIFLFMAYSTYGVFTKWSDANGKLLEAQESYSATVARHEAISKDLETLSTPRGKEEIVREKFNVVKEGEGVVVLPGSADSSTLAAETAPKKKKGFWQAIKGIFTNGE
ncbi:MAG: hypothetical protein KA028_02900 [Candidatus Pacebacteria bacterium]|nr:hypothetical protein [Candidatus Paceibacterota bacterium]MBP9852328.1 hypothetical protein [Candidatus Paceibacterota bacterium]